MKIYLVGGAVRDQLLNYPVYDKDWVVVGSSPEEMIESGYQPVGQDFPVFIHPETGEEYALARTERKSGKGYTGFHYFADKSVTLEDDLVRRDLTINAMAMDEQGSLVDPYGGQKDLADRILRHVSPAFSEDPLRVLRVARFASRYNHLGFRVAQETLNLMQELALTDELEHLTAERVWKEFERALTEKSPWVFLSILHQTKASKKVLPELENWLDTDNWQSIFRNCCEVSKEADIRFACLSTLADLKEVPAFCDRLRTQKATKELTMQCANHSALLSTFDSQPAETKLEILQGLDLFRRPQRLEKILSCVKALYREHSTQSLQPILDEISKIDPKQLIKEGYKGAALGKELTQRKLIICEEFSSSSRDGI